MTIDLDGLEAQARAAAQGEWRRGRVKDRDGFTDYVEAVFRDNRTASVAFEMRETDLAYIVAAQPSVVLELIARVRELEAKTAEPDAYKISVGGYVSLASTLHMAREAAGESSGAMITPLYAAPPSHAALHERVRELEEALSDIIEWDDKFCASMPSCAEKDPLTRAVDRARTALGGNNG